MSFVVVYLTGIIKKVSNLFGFNITRFNKNVEAGKLNWLKELKINCIIDIGANAGLFSLQMHTIFPYAKIYAFKPLKDCYIDLKKNVSQINDIRIFNLALGEKKEKRNIIVNSFAPSSSILEMSTKLKEVFNFINEAATELIEVDTLDSVMSQDELNGNVLMKIDVQGYEKNVLAGAQNILEKTEVIIVELSFEELYIDSPLFEDIYGMLYEKGFRYRGIWDQVNPLNGKPLYQDAVFIKLN